MNQHSRLPNRASLTAALVATLFAPTAWAAFDSGSTGADGVFNPTVNTEVELPPSGILNYTTVNIPTGVTVKFKRNAANTPVYILASGDVTIAGTIDLRGDDAKDAGTYGDGAQGDDGIPGAGGAGGFDGGRGGRDDAQQRAAIIRGGAGLGPGGGAGGVEGTDGCNATTGYYKHAGIGGAYGSKVIKVYSSNCSMTTPATEPYGSSLLQPLVGGSGGGGGRGGTNYPGSGGGGGGGRHRHRLVWNDAPHRQHRCDRWRWRRRCRYGRRWTGCRRIGRWHPPSRVDGDRHRHAQRGWRLHPLQQRAPAALRFDR
ncbi:hypothetical protein ABIE51_002721 [Lysobacter sp. OAE881]|uniref:hypothetical protein n=1 Tax=Lysobacter sp. OAE881 TaxID=2663813 RepID=UPI003397FD8B